MFVSFLRNQTSLKKHQSLRKRFQLQPKNSTKAGMASLRVGLEILTSVRYDLILLLCYTLQEKKWQEQIHGSMKCKSQFLTIHSSFQDSFPWKTRYTRAKSLQYILRSLMILPAHLNPSVNCILLTQYQIHSKQGRFLF